MLAISSIALFAALRFFLILIAPTSLAGAEQSSLTGQIQTQNATSSSYWLANIRRQGTVAYGDSNFQIFRNVKDFGAKGRQTHPFPRHPLSTMKVPRDGLADMDYR